MAQNQTTPYPDIDIPHTQLCGNSGGKRSSPGGVESDYSGGGSGGNSSEGEWELMEGEDGA